MPSPRVYAIYWDAYFQRAPRAVRHMNRFFRTILRGRFMRGLRQYGVGPGRFAGSAVIVPDPSHRLPRSLRSGAITARLKSWIRTGAVPVVPRPNETNLLYVIFAPNASSLGPGLCGYHHSSRYGKTTGRRNLFWAAIQQWHFPSASPRTPQALANACTWCISHEMVEAFTDRDDRGYHAAGCEIGDICECARRSSKIIKVRIDNTWLVEPYWSNKDQKCYPFRVASGTNGGQTGAPIRGAKEGADMGSDTGAGGKRKRRPVKPGKRRLIGGGSDTGEGGRKRSARKRRTGKR